MPEDQIGTIKMISGRSFQYLYNVKSADPFRPSIKCGGQIMVTVNSPTIRWEKLAIEFDLFRGAFKGTIKIDWETLDYAKPTPCHGKIYSREGPASKIYVHYGLFADANVADIELKFLDNSDQDVYGAVAASSSKLQRDIRHWTSMLFVKVEDNPVCVRPDRDPRLPLSKSRVAVPLGATLNVHFHLNCNGKVFKQRLSFKHQIAGEVVSLDTSKMIQVKVTWKRAHKSSIVSTYDDENEGLRI